MSSKTSKDNRYPQGTLIAAKAAPRVMLKIERYAERIYYCTVVDGSDQKEHAYFESELVPPAL